MQPKNEGKKRVRIMSGHGERYIENRSICKHLKRRQRTPSRKTRQHQSCRVSKIGRKRTHKPTVAELVYQFLERASNRGVAKNQKSNATTRFRKIQREQNSNRSRPDASTRLGLSRRAEVRTKPRIVPTKAPTDLESCIFEVLKFGSVLGFLQPADSEGKVFRVASELGLLDDAPRSGVARKRKLQIHDDDELCSCKRRLRFRETEINHCQ